MCVPLRELRTLLTKSVRVIFVVTVRVPSSLSLTLGGRLLGPPKASERALGPAPALDGAALGAAGPFGAGAGAASSPRDC